MLEIFITIIHVLVCAFLILVILLQAGRGGGVSAAFGGGAGVALGQRSAANVLSRVTTGCAATFMITSMSLAAMSSPSADDPLKDAAEQLAPPPAPATSVEGGAPATAIEIPIPGTTAEGAAPAAPATAAEAAPDAPATAAEGAPDAPATAAEGAPAAPATAP